ncbi:MAG: NfeD family protein [Spirochaetaceae bacterium]|jgi:membrane-bound serine protease (ClpP class)|nr:NfeD family protein [Spirochaetaceae bacterium]
MQKKSDWDRLLGKIAVADTPLTPKGQVIIEGQVYPASTEGVFVDAGRGLRVIRVRGNRLTVTLV